MDVRFFYDGNVLMNPSLGGYQQGYQSIVPSHIITDTPCSAASSGFSGPLKWFNGNVQPVTTSPIFSIYNGWTKFI